jgi:hypothetical protein
MPNSTHIEEVNPLLLESENDCRSSFEYSWETADFKQNGDAENPLEWPDSSKWRIVALLSFMGFTMYVWVPKVYNCKFEFKLILNQYIHLHLNSSSSRPHH